jgi:hypothetical protein
VRCDFGFDPNIKFSKAGCGVIACGIRTSWENAFGFDSVYRAETKEEWGRYWSDYVALG